MDVPKKPPQRADYGPREIEPLISTEQAAAMLSVHPKTIQRMARRGEIKGLQIGNRWRFRPSTLLEKTS
jgi:excisionase family DNA binding protein